MTDLYLRVKLLVEVGDFEIKTCIKALLVSNCK